jgi:hypothetical protein
MQVEIFEEKRIDIDSTVFEEWNRRIQLIQELGLKGQEEWVAAYERAKNIPFKILSQEELSIWREFLPTAYRDEQALMNHRFEDDEDSFRTQDYNRDFIPLKALEVWSECRLKGYFSSYQIRTAEIDPVLIGMIGPLHFLIARWGESLKPFEEIKEQVEERLEERPFRLRGRIRRRLNPFSR